MSTFISTTPSVTFEETIDETTNTPETSAETAATADAAKEIDPASKDRMEAAFQLRETARKTARGQRTMKEQEKSDTKFFNKRYMMFKMAELLFGREKANTMVPWTPSLPTLSDQDKIWRRVYDLYLEEDQEGKYTREVQQYSIHMLKLQMNGLKPF
jgi:hypothetical protein